MSSFKQWLMTGKLKTTPPTITGLPDPGDCIDSREAVLFQTANDAVETICSDSQKRENRESMITLMKNKGTKAVKTLPNDFDSITYEFVKKGRKSGE